MSKKTNMLMLLARLIIGGIFIFSGWMKVSEMTMTLGFFSALGIPAFLTYIVAYAELIGGVLIVLGLWTDLAGVGLVIIMLGAVYFTRGGGFAMLGLPLATLAGLLAIVAAGPAGYALRLKEKGVTAVTTE